MLIATVVFWLGRNRFIHVPPGGKEFLKETFSPVGLKAMAKLSVLFLFVAMFWALFDQTSTRWVFQAREMDRNFLGIVFHQTVHNKPRHSVCHFSFPLHTALFSCKVLRSRPFFHI